MIIGDGIADDTAAIQALIDAANGDWVTLPAGTFRITADLFRTAGGGFPDIYGSFHRPGLKLRGAGMWASTIVADYNGTAIGGAIRLDTATGRNYLDGNAIEDLRITQAAGRTGINGIQLTAAWYVSIKRVRIDGLSGAGIKTSWRPDLSPSLSDVYQGFCFDVSHCSIEGNAGWGIDFGAGQSPGLFTLQYNWIARNTGGGVRSTTGQCQIVANAITGNGSFGGQGGLLFEAQEGPSMVADVRHNEFDTNFSWHVNLKRSRNVNFTQNRFLSSTYDSNTGFTLRGGTPFIRPFVHVNLGSGSANEVWNGTFEKNLHRSVTGPGATNAQVIAYAASGGSLSSAFPVHMIHNDFGPMPADGITQNSSGLIKYSGFTGVGAEILDP